MSIDVTATVEEDDIYSAIVSRDISIFLIAAMLVPDESNVVRDVHLRDEIDACEDRGENPVNAALFMKRLAESMITKLRDDPEYADWD